MENLKKYFFVVLYPNLLIPREIHCNPLLFGKLGPIRNPLYRVYE